MAGQRALVVLGWLAAGAAAIGLVWLLGRVLAPFLTALALAYLCDRPTRLVVAWGVPRAGAALAVMLAALAGLALLMLMLWPILRAQLAALAETLPDYMAALREDVLPLLVPEQLAEGLSGAELLRQLGERGGALAGQAGDVLARLVGGGLEVMTVATLVVVTPIVTFYLLRDWPMLTARLNSWLPADYAATVRRLASEIDQRLMGFVAGQALVCLALAAYYGVGLAVIGLDFGLTVGVVAGLISFIPFVGTVSGIVLATLLAVVQADGWAIPVAVLGLFAVGQVLEGNVLQPRLLGSRVGLHPVWVIFALLAGAHLGGFVGLLVAVPVMAALAVLTRFAVARYQASRLFTGAGGEAGS